jgi:hypothetical protein
MRQKYRIGKFLNDKTVRMILISNGFLQLQRNANDAAVRLRRSETHFVRCGRLGK